ncbi:hypothetical protein V5O48_008089 [Marasmius crinis-equi]|uniref:Uncharacterized protein n=1 Tax=Marasmius crinis-equi TaxID=585013 RepID=A0ABR3FF17_9AGAR
MDLTGQVALVTGGGSGIGLMIARGFLSAGCERVYIAGRRVKLLEEIASMDLKFCPLQMDVNDKKSISVAVEVVRAKEGKLDVLVNAAGVPGPSSLFVADETSPHNATLGQSLFATESTDRWRSVFDTNAIAPFFVTMAFVDLLEKGAKARGIGATSGVVNISSASASLKLSMAKFAYSASKAASDHLTVNMAAEFARNDIPIRVNAIQPGVFPSEMTTENVEALNRSLRQKPFSGLMTKGPEVTRRCGRPEEITVPANYLASSKFVNGVILRVDGGVCLLNP